MTQLQKSVTERVKDKLKIIEDVSLFELYDLLYKTRNDSHPDRCDKKFEKEANKKFSELNALLEELKFFIEDDKLNKFGKELIIHKENYENVLSKSQIILLENRIVQLEDEKKILGYENEDLKSQIENLKEEEISKLDSELKELYKPKKNSILVLSISTGLIVIINILIQIKNLRQNIMEILPFDVKFLNLGLFILFIFFILKILFNNYHLERIKKISEELKSNVMIQNFYNIHIIPRLDKFSDKYTKDIFTESDVEKFIRFKYFAKNDTNKYGFYKVLINMIIFPNRIKNVNYLKDIFIYNLISKDLIKIGYAKSLDREFRIK